jgi:mono/diheme cytochrome c family protein
MLYSPGFNKQFGEERRLRMKSVIVTISIVLITLMAIACSKENNDTSKAASSSSPAASATATPDEFASVRPIFKEQCEKCHGPNGEGGQVTVDNKKLRVPSFKAEHALKHKDEDFIDQITNGGDGMPAFKGKLQPQQIDLLMKFVRKEFQKK